MKPATRPTAAATNPRIVDISLGSHSMVTRAADIEIERHKAISDLLNDNNFQLAGTPGPYRVLLSLDGGHVALQVACIQTGLKEDLRFALGPLQRQIQDYVILCDNFYKTARSGQIYRLEAIDVGRRSIHDEAAEMLIDSLSPKIILDKQTARRLFSLLYVLHMRGTPTMT